MCFLHTYKYAHQKNTLCEKAGPELNNIKKGKELPIETVWNIRNAATSYTCIL